MPTPTLLTGVALLVLAATAPLAPAIADPIFVSAAPSTPTLIGTLSAGQTYIVTASGIASLCSVCNGGGALSFTADGKPTITPVGAYAAFGTTGLAYDPSVGPTNFGQGGPGKLLGSLLGTFSPQPAGPSSFFTIGLGTTLTAAVNETLYGVVNDTGYGDNPASTGFSVLLSPVPEPATLALFGAALFGVGLIRHRGKVT